MSDNHPTVFDRLVRAADAVAEAQKLLAQADHEVAMALSETAEFDSAFHTIHYLSRRLSQAKTEADMVPLRRQSEWTGGGRDGEAITSRDCVDIAQYRFYPPTEG